MNLGNECSAVPSSGFAYRVGRSTSVVGDILGGADSLCVVVISVNPSSEAYYFFDGYAHFAGGLACGFPV